ncbi:MULTISPECIES: bifunctional diguanylate cyclase/phosphodiesterase [Halanaerobium]|uniref:Diguanylate cyclase (GGDEF) domain-containing protein n=1 Tax=Halanaerobium kushneri TaxID=56779 RepID=A0A1N6Y6R6_9FIRM|nr:MULTISPECIES: GGDEF domain-containing phosphodiesterase [Halanaerobium]RCW52480.1 diguanylate cyclase/phosphodiesterase [Halanaerobium sp. ST460_2HS_T2]SIR10216.1 diguanylate cyclase (GGDEF) domain-containing protein [Halanaerobium kushneri]
MDIIEKFKLQIEESTLSETSFKKFNLIEEMIDVGIWEYNLEKKQLYLSYWAQNKLNINQKYTSQDPIESIKDYIHPDDRREAQKNWESFIENKKGKYKNIFRIKNKSDYIYIKQSGRFLKDNKDSAIRVIGTTTEITREKQLENKLYQLAYFDDFTNLPNEKYFSKKLEQLIRSVEKSQQTQRFAVFYIEIMDMDNISNVVGSLHGNQTAKKIADSLKSDPDLSLISHYYGNKFLLLFKNIYQKEKIKQKAKKIIEAIKVLWQENKIDYFLDFKIGITVYPFDGENAQTLITRAHHAVHTIEDSNQFYQIYDKNIYYEKLNNIHLKNDLRKAVEAEELSLVYQPKIDLKDEQIVALEALLRWHHPKFGQISPEYFIPIAEQSNLITKITRWLIKKVIKEFNQNQFLRESEKIISINLSAYDLKDDTLITFLENLIEAEKLCPHQIDFEITESIFLDAKEQDLENLHKLKESGFYISLDDFGKGYSSLSYLAKLPIDILKLDMSFIRNLEQKKTRILIEKIIELSHELDFKVVAEGVETENELNILKKLDCDYVQGYYYYRPNSLEKLETIICNDCNMQTV